MLPKEIAIIFANVLKSCYGITEKVRGADYRLSVIVVYNNLKSLDTEVSKELLSTLLNLPLQFHTYDERSPKSILKLSISLQNMLCYAAHYYSSISKNMQQSKAIWLLLPFNLYPLARNCENNFSELASFRK